MTRWDYLEKHEQEVMDAYNSVMADMNGMSVEEFVALDEPVNDDIFDMVLHDMFADAKDVKWVNINEGKEKINPVHFPLSDEDKMTYYDKTVTLGSSIPYEVYKIGDKYYDVYGTELDENGNDLKENKEIKTENINSKYQEIYDIAAKFDELETQYNIDRSILKENGTIYYKNGNMGTDGDWETNGHIPYFMVFYKDSGLGFAKMSIDKEGKLYGCVWLNDGKEKAISFEDGIVTNYPEEFAALLFEQTDMLGKYDISIDDIDLTAPVEKTDYDWLIDENEYEDDLWDEIDNYDDEYYDEEEDEYYDD